MTSTRGRSREPDDRDQQLARWGEWEFICCALVLAPGFVLTAILFWFIQRGSDLARILAAAQALMFAVVALMILFTNGFRSWPVFLALMLAWSAAACLLTLSPRLQAYQALNREKLRPARRPRRARKIHPAPKRR